MNLSREQRDQIVKLLHGKGRTDLILTDDGLFYDDEAGRVADDHFAIVYLIRATFPGAIDSAPLLHMFENALLLNKSQPT